MTRSPRGRPRLVDGRHRVALPRDVRRTLGVTAGDYVLFQFDGVGQVRLAKAVFTAAPPPTPLAGLSEAAGVVA